MSSYLIEKIAGFKNIHVELGEITRCYGDEKLTGICYQNDGATVDRDCNALFVFIGAVPNTDWCNVARDSHGFILTGSQVQCTYSLGTSMDGIFAIGDVRSGSVKRVASSVGDGAQAITQIHQYLEGQIR